MRIYVAVLISAVAGVLIGAVAVYTLRDDEFPVQALITSLPDDVQEADFNEFSPAISLDEYTKRLDSYFRIQTIHDVSRLTSDFDQDVALHLLLARADEDDLERFINQATEIHSTNQRSVVLSAIFGRYAALKPNEALDLALKHDHLTKPERSNVVWYIFSEWSFGDLDAAIGAIQSIPQEFKLQAARAIMWRNDGLPADARKELAQKVGPTDGWIDRTVDSIQSETFKADPRSAFYDRIRNPSRFRERTLEMSEIAGYWFESEGVAVFTEIYDSLESADERGAVIHNLIWGIDDFNNEIPMSILDVVSQFPNKLEARDAVNAVFQHWGNSDPKASFKASLKFDDQLVSDHLRSSLLSHWSRKDAEGLFNETPNLPRRFQGISVADALRKISIDSPQTAIRLAENLDTRALRTSARNALVGGWKMYDAKSAFEWLVTNELDVNAGSDESVWRSTFSKYLQQDYDAARTFVDHHDGKFKESLVKATAEHLFTSDVEQAMAYMQKADSKLRDSMIDQIAYFLAGSDPLEALDYGETLKEQQKDDYYQSMIHSMSYLDFSSLYENIHRVPQNYQSYAASRLLFENQEKHYLNDQELKKLESMVEEE